MEWESNIIIAIWSIVPQSWKTSVLSCHCREQRKKSRNTIPIYPRASTGSVVTDGAYSVSEPCLGPGSLPRSKPISEKQSFIQNLRVHNLVFRIQTLFSRCVRWLCVQRMEAPEVNLPFLAVHWCLGTKCTDGEKSCSLQGN